MGPSVPENTGAKFKEEIDRLFEPEEQEKSQEEDENGDKRSE